MEAKLKFDLIAPDNKVFSGDVDHVIIPAINGQMGILPHHAPFMSTLKPGIVKILEKNKTHYYYVTGGLADISTEGLILLAEHVWTPEIKTQKQTELEEIKQRLSYTKDPYEKRNLTQKITLIETFLETLTTLD